MQPADPSAGTGLLVYTGATGGLGKFVQAAADRCGVRAISLGSRLEDQSGIRTELASAPPTKRATFLHLAAMVSVPACEADPATARRVNVDLAAGTVQTFLQWAGESGIDGRVIYASTGHVYAPGTVGARLTEDDPTAPRSVYARTKLDAELALSDGCAGLARPLTIARIFGLLAPGQERHYVLPSLIARVRDRRTDGIPGLDFSRDYLDARDVCAALVALACRPVAAGPTILNVCSGLPTTIRELLAAVAEELNPGEGSAIAGNAPAGVGRPDDVAWIVGDPSRLEALLGRPAGTLSIPTTVADAVAHA